MTGRSPRAIRAAGILLVIGIAMVASGVFSADRGRGMVQPASIMEAQRKALEYEGLNPEEAIRQLELQGRVDRSKLVAKLKRALGRSFAGVWFDLPRGKLRVAVVSPTAQRTAEELSSRYGLGGDVVVSRSASSWRQLWSAQQRWDQRLADLFDRSEVRTSLDPRANAVRVDLSSAVPRERRKALRERAAAESVRVVVESQPAAKLRIDEQVSRCKKWTTHEAFCNPTIVAGVSIEDYNDNGKCTAGPAVMKRELPTDTTETYILTAGHCIEDVGSGSTWYAWDKNGNPQEIGEAGDFLASGSGDEYDIGVIKVTGNFWKTGTQIPVVPTIAPWEANEPEPFPVPGSTVPVVGHTTCIQGEASGAHCGTITKTNSALGNVTALVEVNAAEPTLDGDSGAPWYSTEAASLNRVEGTHVGLVNGNPVFEPLARAFEGLEKKGEKLKLKLLTTANENRAKCPMPNMACFKGESYPATLSGEQVSEGVFTVNAGTVKCKTATFSGTLAGEASTLELSPTYSECTAFGFVGASIDVNGCKYRFNLESTVSADKASGSVDVVCPESKKIVATAFNCEVGIGSQNGLKSVTYTDKTSASPKKDIEIKVEASGIAYSQTSKSFPGCSSGSFTNGTFKGEATVKGTNGGGSAVGIEVG